MRLLLSITILLCVAAATPPVLAGKGQDQARLEQLQAACARKREAAIEPLRKKAIEECIAEQQRMEPRDKRAYCEEFYRDYGAGHVSQYGGRVKPMFEDDIRECVEARELEHRMLQSGSRSVR